MIGLHLDATGNTAKGALARTIKAWGGDLKLTNDGTGDIVLDAGGGTDTVEVNNSAGVNINSANLKIKTTGGLFVDAGVIQSTAGNVTAAGTPAGNAGPGIVKGNRIYAQGTAIGAGDITVGANWGAGATKGSYLGDDTHGEVVITAAGVPAADPTVLLTFKDGTFTGAPSGGAWLRSAPSTEMAFVKFVFSATTLLITYVGTPIAGSSYTFCWVTFGRT